MDAPTFPTTQEIDVRNISLCDLTPCKAVRYNKHQALDLFRGLRDVNPTLHLADFKASYLVSERSCAWIDSQIGAAQ
jgi:hypothetical protein